MPSHVAASPSSAMVAALSVFSVMVTSLGRGKVCFIASEMRVGMVQEARTKRWRMEGGVLSLEQRRRADEPCIKYSLKATAAIREPGYPSRAQLASWHRERQENGGRLTDRSLGQCTLEQKRVAVRHCSPMGGATPSPGASLDVPSARRSSPSGPAGMHPALMGVLAMCAS